MNAITRRQAAETPARADASDALPFRAAPHNLEAEQALLGAILVNNEAHDRVSGFLEAHHFYDPLHQQIYETLSKLIASGKRATPITLRTFFENAEPLDATTTVPVYLGKLAVNATTIINAREYARTIQNLYTRRQLIIIGEDLVNNAFDSPVDFPPKEQIEEVEACLFSLAEIGENERVEVSAYDALGMAIKQSDEAHRRGNGLSGISLGIPDLDDALGGVAPGHLMILAGRPGMGKTAFGLNITSHLADAGTRVCFISLEMSAEELGNRLLAMRLAIPADNLRRGIGVAENMAAMLGEQQRCARLPLSIDHSSSLTIAQLNARLRRKHRKAPLGLVMVDYLQLLRGTVYRGNNRTQEVAEISAGLKAIAKDLSVPVIALSQLSRATETREDNRPQLSDLRDSGSIEQDADVVAFVHREAYYLERKRPNAANVEAVLDWQRNLEAVQGRAEIIIAKNRHGATDVVEVAFKERTMTFGAPENGRRA
jgi:replicative DNA helicase